MKKRWIVLLLVLAVVFIGLGFYLNAAAKWVDKTYYDRYNGAVVAYNNSEIEKSFDEFAFVAVSSKDNWLKSLAFFQPGYIAGEQALNNKSLSPEERIEFILYAIALFEEAVIINPENQEAKYNLELLINHLQSISQEMQEKGNNGGQSQPGSGYGRSTENRGY